MPAACRLPETTQSLLNGVVLQPWFSVKQLKGLTNPQSQRRYRDVANLRRRQSMKKMAILAFSLALVGCVSRYRDYQYGVYRVSSELTYVQVSFWGEQFVPGWKEKAVEAARPMIERVAAQHHLPGKISIIPEPKPSEGGGISVDAFVGDGRPYTVEEARKIQATIDYQLPHPRGKGKLPIQPTQTTSGSATPARV